MENSLMGENINHLGMMPKLLLYKKLFINEFMVIVGYIE